MAIKNLAEIGENLQKIIKRLIANQNLLKLLYYTDKDPFSHDDISQEVIQHDIFQKLITILPKLSTQSFDNSMLSVRIVEGYKNPGNREFHDLEVSIEIFVPISQWIIKNENLRPYLIMGEIQKSLEGKTINGLGKMEGGDFAFNFVSDEMSAFEMIFSITSYD